MKHRLLIDFEHYRALLFYFDGTLVDTEPIQHKAFVQTLGEYGVSYVSFASHLKDYIGRGSRHIFTQEIKRNKINADIDELLKKRNTRYLSLIKKTRIPLIPGIEKFLKKAKNLGFKLAILSGGHKDNILFVMSHAGIPNVFDAIISIEDVDTPKPDPAGFIKALKICQVKAEESVSIEDGISGIIAAKAAKIGKRIAISRHLDKMQVQKADQETILIQDFKVLRVR